MRPAFTVFLCFLMMTCSFDLWSQEQFSFSIHYTVNDGLPSSKVFDMIQDSKGYIWFVTENGVSRFNGYGFRNFTTLDGLPTNSTVRIYEDLKGRIWFMSYEGPISYYQDGQIHPFPLNDELLKLNISFISNIYVDEQDAIWLSSFTGGLIKIDSNDKISSKMPYDDRRVSGVYFYVDRKKEGKVIAIFNSPPEIALPGASPASMLESGKYYPMPRMQSDNHINYLENNGDKLLAFGSKIYREENDTIILIRNFKDEIITMGKDQKGNLWVSEKFHGVYMFAGGDLSKPPAENFLRGLSVSSILHDREGNYWFATTEGGVYFIPSIDLHIFNSSNFDIASDVVLDLEIRGDDVFFSTDHKEIYHGTISDDRIVDVQSLVAEREFTNNIYAILSISEDSLYISGDVLPQQSDSVSPYKKRGFTIFPVEYGYSLTRTVSGDILLGHFNGIKLIRVDQIHYITPISNSDFRVFDAVQCPDSSLLMGSVHGLTKFSDSSYSQVDADDPVIGSRISKLCWYNGMLWVGTFENGLAIKDKDTIYYIDERHGLSSNRIKVILPENDTMVWIGSNRGLNRVTFVPGRNPVLKIRKLDIWDGLPSNEINEIKSKDGILWLATDKGVASFDPKLIDVEPGVLPLVLDHVVLYPDRELPVDKEMELNHNENSLTFEFYGITFKNPRETVYHYKLDGLSEEWRETKNTSIRFHDLPAGNYNFMLRATDASGASSESIEYRFRIRKHITRTAGFIGLLLAVIAVMIYFVVRNIMNTHQKRLQLQRQIYLAEQKAMLSQMNPHFIFNSLNSIQNFILENDHANANVYLVIFSSLIRKILDASKKNFISLKDEIDIIKLYLELEKFRFQDRFEYALNIEQNIYPGAITIPSMILQPYLENAIWHGIMPKTGKGLITLDVTRSKPGYLKISITDNGIGRKKAGEIGSKRKHHKPTGLKNVEDRLKLLNELNKTSMSVKIIDLVDEAGNGIGTQVEIFVEDH